MRPAGGFFPPLFSEREQVEVCPLKRCEFHAVTIFV